MISATWYLAVAKEMSSRWAICSLGEALAEEGQHLPLAWGEDVGVRRAASASAGGFASHGEVSLRWIGVNYTSRLAG